MRREDFPRLTHKCHLTGAQTATCSATWYTAQRVVGSTKVYAGTFKIDAAYEPTTVTFSGLAASVGCVARYAHASSKRCNSTVHWH